MLLIIRVLDGNRTRVSRLHLKYLDFKYTTFLSAELFCALYVFHHGITLYTE